MAETDAALRNLAWADALVAGLHEGGVGHAVIAPGSRSTPLALAFDRHPGIVTTVLPDERSAAFFALGLGRPGGRPAVFVCTSGSAAGNAFPAVLESASDGVPLIVASADRPAELRQTGANQTTDQTHLYGRQVRAAFDLPAPDDDARLSLPRSTGRRAAEAARWPEPGPVHINLAFREPLVPGRLPEPPPAGAGDEGEPLPRRVPRSSTVDALAAAIAGRPGLIVAGRTGPSPGLPGTLAALARRLGAPILADPLSGLRWGPHDREGVLTAYDLFLRGPDLGPPAWILQFGATPVSAALSRYLAGCAGDRYLVAAGGEWQDPTRGATGRILAEPGALAEALCDKAPAPADEAWVGAWRAAESRAARLALEPDLRPPEAAVVDALEAALPADGRLFVGNSMPIRAIDAFARGREAPLWLHGNRGLSGIDGNVSTALGIGRATGVRPTLLIGDLTLYHDMNGLLATRDVPADVVLLDNGGGGIFALLPQRDLAAFERLWLTPTGLSAERIAALYGLAYRRVDRPDALGPALAAGDATVSRLLHLVIDPGQSARRFDALWRAAQQA